MNKMTYDEMAAQLAVVVAERDALADKCGRLEYNLGNVLTGEQEAIRRADALAAENAALKGFRGTITEIRNGLIGGGRGHMAVAEMRCQDAILDVVFDSFDDIETPATDAAVAAIEARGVEKLADKLDAEIEQIMRGAFFYGEISSREAISKMVREFAAELREGK